LSQPPFSARHGGRGRPPSRKFSSSPRTTRRNSRKAVRDADPTEAIALELTPRRSSRSDGKKRAGSGAARRILMSKILNLIQDFLPFVHPRGPSFLATSPGTPGGLPSDATRKNPHPNPTLTLSRRAGSGDRKRCSVCKTPRGRSLRIDTATVTRGCFGHGGQRHLSATRLDQRLGVFGCATPCAPTT